MKELHRLLGIKILSSMAYHPQMDGQTECLNQELEQYLQLFINQCQDDWSKFLPLAKFSYNNHVHSATQHTPFLVDTGRHPCMGFEPTEPLSVKESVNEFVERMRTTEEEAQVALAKAKDDMAKYYNWQRQPTPKYNWR